MNAQTTHSMHLQHISFEQIETGEKTLELRVYDEKRRAVKPGDRIVFKNSDDPAKTLRVQVRGLLIYSCFADLLNDVPTHWLACAETERADLIARVAAFYPVDEQREFGVVGIRIKRLTD